LSPETRLDEGVHLKLPLLAALEVMTATSLRLVETPWRRVKVMVPEVVGCHTMSNGVPAEIVSPTVGLLMGLGAAKATETTAAKAARIPVEKCILDIGGKSG